MTWQPAVQQVDDEMKKRNCVHRTANALSWFAPNAIIASERTHVNAIIIDFDGVFVTIIINIAFDPKSIGTTTVASISFVRNAIQIRNTIKFISNKSLVQQMISSGCKALPNQTAAPLPSLQFILCRFNKKKDFYIFIKSIDSRRFASKPSQTEPSRAKSHRIAPKRKASRTAFI